MTGIRLSRRALQEKFGFKPECLSGKTLQVGTNPYEITQVIKGRDGHRGFGCEARCRQTEHKVFVKFYFKAMLAQTPNWEQEFTKPNRVQSDNFAHYVFHGDIDIDAVSLTYIAYEWVAGESLQSYITARRGRLDLPFVIEFAKWILGPLNQLRDAKSLHGDLHMGNVMVTETGDHDIPPRERRFKLIDFGVGASAAGMPARDDYRSLAALLAKMLKEIRREDLDLGEQFQFDKLGTGYLKLLTEDAPERSAKNPKSLWDELETIVAGAKRLRSADGEPQSLKSPFEILSADRFTDDSPLLRALFAKTVPGFETLESADTILVTGPRGCGKTMMLKYMSTRSLLTKRDLVISDLPEYLGFYLSSFELFIAFPRQRVDDERPPDEIADEKFKRKTAHHFHLCWVNEMVAALEQLQARFGDSATPRDSCIKLIEFLNANIAPEALAIAPQPLATLRAASDRWRSRSYRSPVEGREGVGFLRDLCRLLREQFPIFNGRRIFFLLDDYSLGRITEALQLSLNRIIFQRQSEFVFKIAAEKEAVLMRDCDGALEPGRTHSELDLGHFFISPDSSEHRMKLLRDVFNNRLATTDSSKYRDIESILGKTSYKDYSQFARVIQGALAVSPESPEYLKKPFYHGIEHLSEVCSGDVAAMISLVQKVLQAGKFDVRVAGQAVINFDRQDSAIKDFSRNFLEQIGGEQRRSSEVRSVAKAFGEMARWKLLNQNSTNEKLPAPFMVGRLEVYIDAPLATDVDDLFRALLRYGVFIQEPRGFGQGDTLSLRLYFRRLFLPTFGLSFSRRDCLRFHMTDFCGLLRNPTRVKEEKIAKWQYRLKNNPEQPLLIGDPGDYEFD